MVWLDAMAQPLQVQAILAYECAQISAIIDSISRIEIFQMDGVEISIIDDPRPLHNHDTPNAVHNTYTPIC